nr:indole-3-acetic acid-induced protein ARG7-like [Ziziphus jujuba var. spinosa]
MAKLGLKCGSAQDTSKKRRVKKMVPTGYFPVYVGDDEKVYVIPIKILSETLFKALLNQFKDENTTLVNKPITIGCTSQFFEEILNAVNCKYKVFGGDLQKAACPVAGVQRLNDKTLKSFIRDCLLLL